jgi:hypothetical protein
MRFPLDASSQIDDAELYITKRPERDQGTTTLIGRDRPALHMDGQSGDPGEIGDSGVFTKRLRTKLGSRVRRRDSLLGTADLRPRSAAALGSACIEQLACACR